MSPLLSAAAVTEHTAAAVTRIVAIVAVAALASWLTGSVVGRLTTRLVEKASSGGTPRATTRSETITSVLTAIGRVVIWTVAILLVLGELGFDLAPLIAGAGIVGVAIGFGAQSLVADFLSGLFMLMEDQYGVGDWVDVGDAMGTVEHVGLRTTRIRSLDGLLWTVRNGEIVRTANANQGWGRAVVDVGVGYDVDLTQAQELIADVARRAAEDPDLAERFLESPEVWGIQDLGDDAVSIRLVAKTAPGAQWSTARALRLRVKDALDDAGMEIPFPQRTVWLRTEADSMDESIPVSVGSDGTG